MILPGQVNQFQGVIGGTFDTEITLYQGVAASIWSGVWVSTAHYVAQAVVVDPNNNVAYISTASNTDIVPSLDNTGIWTSLTPLDLTGYTGAFQIGDPSTSGPTASDDSCTMGGSAGTVGVNISAASMADFTHGTYPCYLKITDASSNVYFPIIGQICIINPI